MRVARKLSPVACLLLGACVAGCSLFQQSGQQSNFTYQQRLKLIVESYDKADPKYKCPDCGELLRGPHKSMCPTGLLIADYRHELNVLQYGKPVTTTSYKKIPSSRP